MIKLMVSRQQCVNSNLRIHVTNSYYRHYNELLRTKHPTINLLDKTHNLKIIALEHKDKSLNVEKQQDESVNIFY